MRSFLQELFLCSWFSRPGLLLPEVGCSQIDPPDLTDIQDSFHRIPVPHDSNRRPKSSAAQSSHIRYNGRLPKAFQFRVATRHFRSLSDTTRCWAHSNSSKCHCSYAPTDQYRCTSFLANTPNYFLKKNRVFQNWRVRNAHTLFFEAPRPESQNGAARPRR